MLHCTGHILGLVPSILLESSLRSDAEVTRRRIRLLIISIVFILYEAQVLLLSQGDVASVPLILLESVFLSLRMGCILQVAVRDCASFVLRLEVAGCISTLVLAGVEDIITHEVRVLEVGVLVPIDCRLPIFVDHHRFNYRRGQRSLLDLHRKELQGGF